MTKRTKVFFDTEFTGLHQQTTLISIGMIAETGHTFYAELTDFDKDQINDWIQEFVINNLLLQDKEPDHIKGIKDEQGWSMECKGDSAFVSGQLKDWLSQFEQVEMWSDCLAFDWVLFINLYGNAFQLPGNVYYIPFDLSTYFKIRGIDADISRKDFCDAHLHVGAPGYKKHNSLYDAIIIKTCYDKLKSTIPPA